MVITTQTGGIQIKRYNGKTMIHKVPGTLSGHLDLPQQITHIQKTSFVGCNKITSITIPESVRSVKAGAFAHCTSLEKICVSPDNKYFENDSKGALYTKGRQWLICVPQAQQGIWLVPNGVRHIEKEAFHHCRNITTLMLSQTVCSIGAGAFQDCTGLLHMTIPPKVTKIEPGAFAGCTQLCGLTVASDNENFVCREGALFNRAETELLYVPATLRGQQGSKDGRYRVPECVTGIAPYAFYGCGDIEEVVLPSALKSLGEHAFDGCSRLTTVYAPAGIVKWQEQFADCKNLKHRYIRDPLGIIYDRDTRRIVRVWKDIDSAELLNGLTEVEANAFANCSRLTTVSIPKSVTEISDCAFKGCKNLTTFTVAADNPVFYTDDSGVLYKKIHNNVVLLRAPTDIGEVYRIPEGVTHIVPNAFESCLQLKTLAVANSVWAIAQGAFADCPNLTVCAKPGSEGECAARKHAIPVIQK